MGQFLHLYWVTLSSYPTLMACFPNLCSRFCDLGCEMQLFPSKNFRKLSSPGQVALWNVYKGHVMPGC